MKTKNKHRPMRKKTSLFNVKDDKEVELSGEKEEVTPLSKDSVSGSFNDDEDKTEKSHKEGDFDSADVS
jgi:hypothetical protein